MRQGRLTTFVVVVLVIAATVSAFLALRPSSTQGAASGRGQQAITDQMTVDKGNLTVVVTATGSVVASQQSALTFDATGIVRQVLVQEGQRVDAGQTLAMLDDSSQQSSVKQAELNLQAAQVALNKVLQPVDPNNIALAEADVKAAQGSLQSKAGNVTQASIAAYQAKVQQAQADKDYADKLLNDAGGRSAKSDPSYQLALAQDGQADFNLQIARLNLQEAQKGSPVGAAQANIALNQAKLAQVKAGPKQSEVDQAQTAVVAAQSQLDQAKSALAKTALVAPYAGVVTQVTVKVGQPAQGTAMTITDLSNLYITVKVDEGDITRVAAGQKVDLTLDALPGVAITGKVDRIGSIADATASVITYPVRVILDKTTEPIRAGMTANATLHVKEVDNVLRVPNSYLKVNQTTGQATISVVNPDGISVSTVPVRLGVQGSDYTEIIDGLNPGDVIAVVAQPAARTQTGGGQGGGFPAGGPPGQ